MLKLLKTGALAWTLTDAGFVLTTPSRREHTPQHLESIWANQRTETNADLNRIVLIEFSFLVRNIGEVEVRHGLEEAAVAVAAVDVVLGNFLHQIWGLSIFDEI